MKTIELKTVTIASGPHRGETLTYSLEYLAMVETFPEGITAKQMSLAIKIADKLMRANGSIELEDAEAAYLLERAEQRRYTTAARELVEMTDNLR